MSTKTFFRRAALVIVSALAFGSMPMTSANADYLDGLDDTLTLSASSATVTIGDTASVTATISFTSRLPVDDILGVDSRSVVVTGDAPGTVIAALPTQDTVNALTARANTRIARAIQTNIGTAQGTAGVSVGDETRITTTAGSAIGTGGFRTDSVVALTNGAYTKAAFTITAPAVTRAGVYVWTISLRDNPANGKGRAGIGAAAAAETTKLYKTATFTLTVTAGDTTATAAQSRMWLHNSLYVNSGGWYPGTPLADSTIVANAGPAATPAIVGYLVPDFRNAASETVNATSGQLVHESMTVVVSGPGLLGFYAAGGRTSQTSTYTKSVTIGRSDTIIVYSDGTAGVGTFTASIGGVNLTQAAKTITFVGKVASFVVTVESPSVVTGSTAKNAISFVAKDSAGNNIGDVGTVQYNTGTPSGFYALVSDTTVIGGTAVTNTASFAYTACTYQGAPYKKYTCDLPVTDSGVASVTIADSLLASNAVVAATPVSITVAGSAITGTMAFDKSTYAVGEKMILTLTATDRAGRAAVDGARNPFGTITWSTAPEFRPTAGSDAAGGTFGTGATYATLEAYVASGTTFVKGTDTAVVYAPNKAGTYTLTTTTTSGATAVTATFKVTDAAADAQNAAIAASQAAADAATDAALEAIDAANAATDAANLAAEAADAATVAAEEARDAADAATAAVEALATEVATLMAALKAQITTLARTVAKIAAKVKA